MVALLICMRAVTAADTRLSSEYHCTHDDVQMATDGESGAMSLSSSAVASFTQSAHVTIVASGMYEPIRITMFAHDVQEASRYCSKVNKLKPMLTVDDATCKSADILTPAKKAIFFFRRGSPRHGAAARGTSRYQETDAEIEPY